MPRPACLVLASLLAASPLSAQVIAYEAVEVDADPFVTGGERSLPPAPAVMPAGPALVPAGPVALPAYGPFRVLDPRRAALVDVTDGRSPEAFAAMLRDHPGIATIEMLECPGTEDDLANLRLGRMIRAHGMATHVPAGGSVRSGGVELFLAGARRSADPGAEFAVHSWMDDTGLEPDDYAAAAPENRRYLDYYRQMGMSLVEAEAFYAMTNSVPFASARWFDAAEMARWVRLDAAQPAEASPSTPPATMTVIAPAPSPVIALVLDSPATLQ
ncbi:alpha/beta hydrolase [Novosphingobium soli]|uniref:Alpha/beta hydrolase n=1 Tax=Novosphingobium soli TaxID=574956 RepID=A0ABV6D0G8_9SPHN